MTPGARRTSPSGTYRLDFQTDGNVVVYRNSDNHAMWNIGSTGTGADTFTLCMVNNGGANPPTIEACLYNPNGLYWHSAGYGVYTDPNYTTYLDMQDDGNLVLSAVQPSWATNTKGASTATNNVFFLKGTRIYPGSTYSTGNGTYQLQMRTDGNLVVLQGGIVKWSSGTANRGAAYAEMQTDGNFVIYTSARQALWASGTYKKAGAYLVFQNDGNLVIYYPKPVWDSFGYAGR